MNGRGRGGLDLPQPRRISAGVLYQLEPLPATRVADVDATRPGWWGRFCYARTISGKLHQIGTLTAGHLQKDHSRWLDLSIRFNTTQFSSAGLSRRFH